MSNPLFLPTNTSPVKTVRSFGHIPTRNHEITSSQKRPTAITTTAIAQPIRADPFPRPSSDGAVVGRNPPHTEEDWGAGHRSSAANSIRRHPTQSGSHDREHIFQNGATFSDAPKSLPPSLSSLSLSIERTRPLPLTTLVRTYSTGSQLASSGSADAISQSPDHLVSSGPLDAYKSAAPATNHSAWPSLSHGTKSQGALEYTRMSGACDREGEHNQNATKSGEWSSDARREAFSAEKRNKSSSRSGKGRVEKRIEATLAQAEPGSSVRSRKSSHVLGLFKENTVSQDVRKNQDKPKPSPASVEDDAVGGRTGPDSEHAKPKGSDAYQAPTVVREKDTEKGLTDPSIWESKQNQESGDSVTRASPMQQARRNLSTGSSTSRILTSLSNDETQNGGDAPVASPKTMSEDSAPDILDVPRSDVPQRLLEEIRNHHNLAAPFHDKFRSSHKATSADHGRIETASSQGRSAPSGENPDDHKGEGSLREKTAEPDEEDDEESDKEQISSALYYPHQAPSPTALEDVGIDHDGQFKDPQYAGEPGNTNPGLPESPESETASENVDIALQSRNKSRYLHGDLQKARVPPTDATAITAIKAVESGTESESEYESLDESARSTAGEYSSLTDEAETTPTATPVATRFMKSRLPRVRRPPAVPLGAVELKPYNHQVGGHTTVFRFSKRAVCKQLSNRENEFYEVVECEHPDLLKFLPRYDAPPSLYVFSPVKVSKLRISQAIPIHMSRPHRVWSPANAHFSSTIGISGSST